MTALPRGKRMDRQRCKLLACPGILGFWIPTASEMWLLPDVWESQMCVCELSRFSRVRLFATPGTVACQALCGILQAKILEYQSGWLLSKSLQAINAGEGVEKREPSYTVGGNAN